LGGDHAFDGCFGRVRNVVWCVGCGFPGCLYCAPTAAAGSARATGAAERAATVTAEAETESRGKNKNQRRKEGARWRKSIEFVPVLGGRQISEIERERARAREPERERERERKKKKKKRERERERERSAPCVWKCVVMFLWEGGREWERDSKGKDVRI